MFILKVYNQEKQQCKVFNTQDIYLPTFIFSDLFSSSKCLVWSLLLKCVWQEDCQVKNGFKDNFKNNSFPQITGKAREEKQKREGEEFTTMHAHIRYFETAGW